MEGGGDKVLRTILEAKNSNLSWRYVLQRTRITKPASSGPRGSCSIVLRLFRRMRRTEFVSRITFHAHIPYNS